MHREDEPSTTTNTGVDRVTLDAASCTSAPAPAPEGAGMPTAFRPPKPSSELAAAVVQMTAPYLQELSREQARIEQKLDLLIAQLTPPVRDVA
eukprot:3258741-Prymnesium_polylepis.1